MPLDGDFARICRLAAILISTEKGNIHSGIFGGRKQQAGQVVCGMFFDELYVCSCQFHIGTKVSDDIKKEGVP